VPIAPVIPPAPKPTCNFSFSWDATNSILRANLQIGDCRVQPSVKIDMNTTEINNRLIAIQNKLDVDISPTLNLAWNKINLEVNPTLNLVWNKINLEVNPTLNKLSSV
jgi:hypothetical protein